MHFTKLNLPKNTHIWFRFMYVWSGLMAHLMVSDRMASCETWFDGIWTNVPELLEKMRVFNQLIHCSRHFCKVMQGLIKKLRSLDIAAREWWSGCISRNSICPRIRTFVFDLCTFGVDWWLIWWYLTEWRVVKHDLMVSEPMYQNHLRKCECWIN